MSAEEGSVCPPAEELEVEGAVVCPVEGCGSEFPSSSHLHMHVARHHEGRKLRGKGGGRQAFYCPVGKCERSEGGGKPFPRLGQLKQVHCIYSTCTTCHNHDPPCTALPECAWPEGVCVWEMWQAVWTEGCVSETRGGVWTEFQLWHLCRGVPLTERSLPAC